MTTMQNLFMMPQQFHSFCDPGLAVYWTMSPTFKSISKDFAFASLWCVLMSIMSWFLFLWMWHCCQCWGPSHFGQHHQLLVNNIYINCYLSSISIGNGADFHFCHWGWCWYVSVLCCWWHWCPVSFWFSILLPRGWSWIMSCWWWLTLPIVPLP